MHVISPSFHPYLITQLLLSFIIFISATLRSVDELWHTANQLWESGDLDSVMTLLQHMEMLQPGDPQVLGGMASVYHRHGEFTKSLELLDAILSQDPRDFKVLQRMGEIYADQLEIPKALEYFHAAEREVNRMNIHEVDGLMRQLALTYHHGKDFAMAEKFFNRVLAAGDAYNEALEIDPTHAKSRLGIGALHHQFGDVNESIPLYLQVINSPSAPVNVKIMAMGNIGAAYEMARDIVKALSWYKRALEETSAYPDMIYPDHYSAQTAHMHLMVHVVRAKLTACLWTNAEDEFDSLWKVVTNVQIATGTEYIMTPFDSLLHAISPLERKMLAVRFSTMYTLDAVRSRNNALSSQFNLPEDKHSDRVTDLNIGYLSYDYTDHPTMHLMEGIFATRSRSFMKVIAFGYGRDDRSAIRQRVIDSVDQFVNLSTASFEESITRVRDENVHIIMDAQGHTHGSRMEIVAARPAPVVVNYLVYPGTSGAPFVDYVVVDKYVVPPAELASAFTEKLVVLPNSYQVNYYVQFLASAKRVNRRADLWEVDEEQGEQGIDDEFMFVNFNKIDKLKASVFSTWMAILRRVPRSSLLLLDPGRNRLTDDVSESVTSREIKKNLWKEALAQGISRERIQFVSRIPKVEHLQRHRRGGLFLDTFIYGAHSTATDALYAGLPVITLAGDSFASVTFEVTELRLNNLYSAQSSIHNTCKEASE
ncbi:UDP-N-acetylglucosamine-peptide N-acetylglucosaminyltransferase [Phytophthora megakarya]|uniref:protein O-GlcNAc transferase n=1 Tax=Phytophthora megakarya TaxID=4795 RepID=A0A225W0X1_9STRA|nr:UDP-N-acetylglucosamine-peptide N-acetylglucosaminyltransferase [Phytophthora megakarya]